MFRTTHCACTAWPSPSVTAMPISIIPSASKLQQTPLVSATKEALDVLRWTYTDHHALFGMDPQRAFLAVLPWAPCLQRSYRRPISLTAWIAARLSGGSAQWAMWRSRTPCLQPAAAAASDRTLVPTTRRARRPRSIRASPRDSTLPELELQALFISPGPSSVGRCHTTTICPSKNAPCAQREGRTKRYVVRRALGPQERSPRRTAREPSLPSRSTDWPNRLRGAPRLRRCSSTMKRR